MEAEIAGKRGALTRVDSCSVPIHDNASAGLATVAIGDLVDFAYTGSCPWTARQPIVELAHHIAPDDWTLDLKAYPAIVTTQWDLSLWDVDTWTLGADLSTV